MTRFLVDIAKFGAILLASMAPLIYVARQHAQLRKVRKFLIVAAALAVATSVVAKGSRDLVDNCVEAGNLACFDAGSAGMNFLLIGGFMAWAMISAYLIYSD